MLIHLEQFDLFSDRVQKWFYLHLLQSRISGMNVYVHRFIALEVVQSYLSYACLAGLVLFAAKHFPSLGLSILRDAALNI